VEPEKTTARKLRVKKGVATTKWRGEGESKELLTLAIVAEAHLGLAETNRVLSAAHTIEFFELGLLHILLL